MAVQETRIGEMPQDEGNYDSTTGGVKVSRRGNRAVVDFNPGAARMSQDDFPLEHTPRGSG